MNYTNARCGHAVIAVGAEGSKARQECESEPCERCREEGWRGVAIPPHNSRTVVLRFDDSGERDREGFYWRPEGCWYTSEGSKAKRNAVHPIMWREKGGES